MFASHQVICDSESLYTQYFTKFTIHLNKIYSMLSQLAVLLNIKPFSVTQSIGEKIVNDFVKELIHSFSHKVLNWSV